MGTINTKYKDRLFRLLFSTKKELLDLYNAVNGSNYKEAENLEVTTLEDAVYMGMKNDVSFLLDDILNLYEHQSTYNPNMPIRGLFYLSNVYRKYIKDRKLNLYGSKLIKLPLPRYLIFYNGLKEEPDRLELNLSDAFSGDGKAQACLEFRAVLLNINLGHNKELMEKCRILYEYASFIASIREHLKRGEALEAAVDHAVDECISKGILSKFLSKHRAEVQNMILAEYDEQAHMAMEREEGREEGEVIKLIRQVRKKIKKGVSVEACADMLEEDTTVIKKIYDILNDNPDWDDIEVCENIQNEG